MKLSLKLFCIVLIAAGLALPACKKKEEAADEAATAEETEEAGEEEEGAEEEEPAEEDAGAEEAEEADTGAEADAAAEGEADAAAEGDEEGAAAEGDKEEAKKAAPKPKTPPFTGTVQGNLSGSGISNGKIKLTVKDDYSLSGMAVGKREGASFRLPLKGSVNEKTNEFLAKGVQGNNQGRFKGKVTQSGVSGTLSGKIHGKDFETGLTLSQ